MSERPNILLILVDDMGYSDIGCFGGEVQTPNIDRLMREGVGMTDFYNTARCCPTRASLLTGLHPHQTGIGHMTHSPQKPPEPTGLFGYRGFLNRNCVTMAEALRQGGYHTYMAGKWHLGQDTKDKWPLQRGFDRFYGILAGSCNYFKPRGLRGIFSGNEYDEPKGDYYTTDAFTDYALRFMKESPEGEPFFLYLAYNAPHWPLQAPEADVRKYKEFFMRGWDALRPERYERMKKLGIIDGKWQLSAPNEEIPRWDSLSEEKQREMAYRMAVYAAQIDRVDQNVGRVLEYLDQTGQADNTLIFFLSDNGGCAEGGILGRGNGYEVNKADLDGNFISYGMAWANLSNTPYRMYKCFIHEGGMATPMIMRWPRGLKNPGRINKDACYLPDVMPTVLEAAGCDYPTEYKGNAIPPLVGKSMMPILADEAFEPHEYMYWEHQDNCAIRQGRWKGIQKYDTDVWELYDLENDRSETRDLAQEHPEIVKRLSDKWHAWAKAYHVSPKPSDLQ